MSAISTFTHISIDGFFAGPNGEIDWFHSVPKDPEFDKFTHRQSSSRNTLLMGRTTYEMMKAFWPTDEATKSDPEMADVMRNSPKIVFSKSLQSLEEGPNWKNLTLLRDVRELKKDGNMTVLGSGSIVQQLANLGLIDEFNLVVVPVVLGAGKPLFKDVKKTALRLRDSKSFGNGVAVHTYSI
jgi:dihydrofolate reductase